MLRAVAFLTGLLILAAAAHVTVLAGGGYSTPHAVLVMAVASGTAVGAIVIGAAVNHRRYTLATLIALALVAGESFGLLSTAERLIAAREAQQAPLRAVAQQLTSARARVAKLENDLALAPTSSPRLAAALSAKAAADQAATTKASERGCKENCRQLLSQQVNDGAAEVSAARTALEHERTRIESELKDARTALAAIKPPPSGTPLADRLGVPAWVLDLVAAALGSIGANGLAVGLLAFAGHQRTERRAVATPAPPRRDAPVIDLASTTVPDAEPVTASPVPARDVSEEAAWFGVESLTPSKDGAVSLSNLLAAYRDWCADKGRVPAPAAEIGVALANLFRSTGVRLTHRDGQPMVLGVAIHRPPAIAPMRDGKAA